LKKYVVALPSGSTVPFNVAAVSPTALAPPVDAIGAPGIVAVILPRINAM
jgi:hypothetical protein